MASTLRWAPDFTCRGVGRVAGTIIHVNLGRSLTVSVCVKIYLFIYLFIFPAPGNCAAGGVSGGSEDIMAAAHSKCRFFSGELEVIINMATTAAAPSSRFETIKVLPDTRRLFFFLVSNKLRKPLPTNASLSTSRH